MKKHKKWKRGSIVRIKWVDSAATYGWQRANTKPSKPSRCETFGFVIADKKSHVTVAMNSAGDFGDYGEQMSIPRACITEITALEPVGGR